MSNNIVSNQIFRFLYGDHVDKQGGIVYISVRGDDHATIQAFAPPYRQYKWR